MYPPLAAGHPFEVLHGIGDIRAAAIDPGSIQCTVQEPPRRADKGPAGKIFGITRLLTHKHDLCALRTFAKNCLRSAREERAGSAVLRQLGEPANIGLWRDQEPGRLRPSLFRYGIESRH